jgi:hypothetical protein
MQMTTTSWELLVEKRGTIAPSLRRQFWLPLRRLLKMFHVLPVAAAAAVFFLLAFDGQLTEIYITYLEDIASPEVVVTVFRFVAVALAFGLISAVLYEAHYRLSGPRINVIFSMNSEVGTGSRLRHVQDVSAILIALSPWLGLAAGLYKTNISLTDVFIKIRSANADLKAFGHVPIPSNWAIAGALLVLAAAMAWLAAAYLKSRSLQRAVMLLNPLAAVFVLWLLIGTPAFSPTTVKIVAAAITAVTVLIYYVVYYRIQLMRAYIFRAHALQDDNNFSLRQWQRIILFAWALLPWVLALALYFLFPGATALKALLADASVAQPGSKPLSPLPSLAMIPVAVCWVSAIGLAVAALLHNVRDSSVAKFWLYGIVCALAAAGLLIFWLATAEQIVILYQLAGPLSALALSLLFVISVFVLLAVLSQRSNFPALTLSILVLVASATLPLPAGVSGGLISGLCLALAIVAVLSRLFPAAALALLLIAIVAVNYFKSQNQPLHLNDQIQGANLTRQFNAWLSSRGVPLANGKPSSGPADSCFAPTSVKAANGQPAQYPVYIIAVEGGGIYAASAGSVFLARLQDENPCFSDHVFAISAVSGGAIGSTIFQSLENARLTALLATGASQATLAHDANTPRQSAVNSSATSQSCQLQSGSETSTDFPLEGQVCRIIQGDHFSPLVGSIFPEMLGFVSKGRAKELAASFQHSVEAESQPAGVALGARYTGHWVSNSKAPALVLNATWVETGLRTAFAPFPLHAIDDSLYSFRDADMPKNSEESLIDAAVVSARFPFVLPPYSVEINPKAPSQAQRGTAAGGGITDELERWNFVDGGYSDSSGAATALAMYKWLQSTAQSRHVALRVILLTSSDPKLKPDQINGTTFADIMGPMNAILSVRNGLANEAVARACDGVMSASPSASNGGTLNTCEDRANKTDSALQIVGIEDTTYGLSLGWKISQTTFGVVSWMLGQPNLVNDSYCNGATNTPSEPGGQTNGQFILNEHVVLSNSCVLLSVQRALNNGPTPATPTAAAPTPADATPDAPP